MFKVNDTIVYGSEGVFMIVDIEEKEFVGIKKTYYCFLFQFDKNTYL